MTYQDYIKAANVALSQLQLDTAVAHSTLAIALQPFNFIGYKIRARAYYNLRLYDKALSDLNMVLILGVEAGEHLEPDWYLVQKCLADCYQAHGENVSAHKHYTSAITLRPDIEDLYLSRGNSLLKMDKLNSAIADFQKALEINPHSSSAAFNLGLAYKSQGNVFQAILHFKKSVELDPSCKETAATEIRAMSKKRKNSADDTNEDVIHIRKATRPSEVRHLELRVSQLEAKLDLVTKELNVTKSVLEQERRRNRTATTIQPARMSIPPRIRNDEKARFFSQTGIPVVAGRPAAPSLNKT